MSRILFLLLLWMGKTVNWLLANVIKRGGSAASGKIVCRIQKDFVRHFKGIDYDRVVFVTGTNGKTSTTNMLASVLRQAGLSVATNSEGANMLTGVATTLMKHSTLGGKFNRDYLILEIDERSIGIIHKQLPGRKLIVTNILKDQVQRNGDPDFIWSKIASVIDDNMHLYLNAQEPRGKGFEQLSKHVTYYGIARNGKSYEKDGFYEVTLPCPVCGSKIAFDFYNVENVGDFHCTSCGFRTNPNPDILIDDYDVEARTITCAGKTFNVFYTLPFYIYNYAVCIAACRDFGLTDEQIEAGFMSFQNPNERRNALTYKGKEIKYLQFKQENPETLQNALRTVAEDPTEKAIFIGLHEICDFDPHYTNTFYFFDCNFEDIARTPVEKYIVFSRTVAYDTALRMRYAGADMSRMEILPINDIETVFAKFDELKTDNIYIISNMKPVKQIKKYFADRAAQEGTIQ